MRGVDKDYLRGISQNFLRQKNRKLKLPRPNPVNPGRFNPRRFEADHEGLSGTTSDVYPAMSQGRLSVSTHKCRSHLSIVGAKCCGTATRGNRIKGVSETLCMRVGPCEFHGSFVEPFWI